MVKGIGATQVTVQQAIAKKMNAWVRSILQKKKIHITQPAPQVRLLKINVCSWLWNQQTCWIKKKKIHTHGAGVGVEYLRRYSIVHVVQ